jgi:hypothetical protein
VHGAASPDAVQHLVVHDNYDSVHELQITESTSDLESVDWRVPLINHLKDPSQARDRKIRQQALKCSVERVVLPNNSA